MTKPINNILDQYSSNIKHIIIPLPNFIHYHQTESETLDDANGFVGRRAIISKMKSWITNEHTLTGAYLVTGYRGMGKSSFVGKVLYELTQHHRYIKERYFQIIKAGLLIFTFICCTGKNNTSLLNISHYITYASMILGGLILWISHLNLQRKYAKLSKDDKSKVDNGVLRTEYIPVRINVGNELLSKNEDIMRLIVKNIHDTFIDYIKKPSKHLIYSYTVLCSQSLFIMLFMNYANPIIIPPSDYYAMNGTLRAINSGFLSIVYNYPYIITSISTIALYFISIFLLEKLFILVDRVHFLGITTLEGIKYQMRRLYLKSIASIDEDYSSGMQYVPFRFEKKKYEKATVREMEQSLITIFEKLQQLRHSLLHFNIRFIIVLDELDKVENSSDEHREKNELPSYEISISGFSGTLNARKRKQELMRTLANMKYFLSTVKAKFIFIAGRELYDAYLADVSDREFAISSVFDGIINVNSFFKPGSLSMDITAMTEEYICNRLLPKNATCERKLSSYHQYMNEHCLEHKERNDRNTAFLYQYILYLSHLSNGSPKKIAVYFEKDIRTQDYLTKIKNIELEDNYTYYLSFGIKDIQKIGFMHYISYPIMQAMVGKSKIYEDKLLVSTSFMINHIYKYHNTGFSWRNLEHIPELLDMNKTPELRDFLGTIIAFLRQTHLSPIQSGLYLFKFPMKISEEISFFSKRIEDVSALFHFSKDESLPVKKHYIRLLDYYTEKRNQITGEELHTLASIHHILADIYQADEDYSQAIYEYQTGLQLLSKQLTTSDFDKDAHWISYMLFLIRNMMKLGIAFEKRKTFDSAYTAYSELEKKLIDYRQFKEKELQLKYNFEQDNFHTGKNAVLYQSSNFQDDHDPFIVKGQFKEKELQLKYNFKEENCHIEKCAISHQENKSSNPPEDDEPFIVKEWKDNKQCNYAFQADHIGHEFSRILSPIKYSILMRQSFFYDLRLAYLPTLAKLFVLEKMETEGITRNNVDLAEAEFFYLHVFVDDSDKPMIYADFFSKLGDILYYKNGLIEARSNNIFQAVYYNGFVLKDLADKLCKLFLKKNIKTYYTNRQIIEKLFLQSESEIKIGSNKYLDSIAKEICKHIESTDLEEEVKKLLEESQFNIYHEKRLDNCIKHRKKLLASGKRLPCFACKYYNLSFDSILKRILNHKIEMNHSKSVNIMIWLIKNKDNLKGFKESYLLLAGNTIKGLANVMLSCSDEDSIINDKFLNKLFNSFENFYKKRETSSLPIFAEDETDIKPIEKSLLLYMESAIFFDMAGCKSSAVQMFRQVLEVFNFYLRICRADLKLGKTKIQIIKQHLSHIQTMVDHIIMILHAHYDSVNILEVDKLKDLYGKGVEEDIPLNQLPLSPDIEELLYRFYSIKIRCGERESIAKLYSCNLMGKYKQISTLSQDVQNLRFKILMNEEIFYHITGVQRSVNNFQDRNFIDYIYNYFIKSSEPFDIMEQYNIKIEDKSFNGKVDILNYFIVDTLACLSKISNMLQPLNNPAIFTSYFLGDINLYTEFWKRIYDGLYILYNDADNYADTGLKTKDIPKEENKGYENFRKVNNLYQDVCCYLSNHKDINKSLCSSLEKYIRSKIDKTSFERLSWNYNAELAVSNYDKAIEMHTEGRAYKEMITTLYFLDDDLNNDTLQQQIAIERYLINSGNIESRIQLMQERLQKSRIFNINNYIN